jgi:hypothetical protein
LDSIILKNSNQIINFEIRKVKQLDVNFCNIESIESGCFEIFKHLEILDLSYSQLGKINQFDFICLGQLKHLDLSNNKIKTIHSNSFSNLSKLEYLGLGFNSIEKIESKIFENLISLKHLDLRTRQNIHLTLIQNTTFFLINLNVLECSFKTFHDNFEILHTLSYLKIIDNDDYFMGGGSNSSPNLKGIYIEIDKLNRNTVEYLNKLTSLEELELKLSSEKPVNMLIFNNLKSLRIKAKKLNTANLQVNSIYKNLKEFCYCSSFVTLSEFVFDFNKLPNITQLHLENLRLDKSSKTLKNLKFLESFSFKNVEFNDFYFVGNTLLKFPNLSVTKLNGCKLNEKHFLINEANALNVEEFHLDFNSIFDLNTITRSFGNNIKILSIRQVKCV